MFAHRALRPTRYFIAPFVTDRLSAWAVCCLFVKEIQDDIACFSINPPRPSLSPNTSRPAGSMAEAMSTYYPMIYDFLVEQARVWPPSAASSHT